MSDPRRIPWPAVRAYFLALPLEKRTYAEAARRFKISDVSVGAHAKAEGWAAQAEALEERVEKRALTLLVRSRAERLSRTLQVFDRINDLALEMIPLDEKGQVDLAALGDAKPKIEALLSSMPGLFKMAELAAGEATDRVAISELQPVLVAFAKIAVVHATPENRGQVIRELEQASAGLVELGASSEAAA